MANTAIEKEIFNLVHKIGETLNKDFHILQTEMEYYTPDVVYKIAYRIYHSNGHCIDISMTAIESEETVKIEEYEYSVLQDWEGFKEISMVHLHTLLLKEKNK
ncbi:hypothetical protein J2810_004579 [Chryseobacterium rhizosphaerae]|uniref:hypothetical protein n=1 Tax=Chryseobacterium rhizosphaerae TaxID=395937 RepID=UPI00285960BB|nr:hypothetical protein [Chryseobacterium rhizosphaerae]MDR6548489.1 hypothetical protein [Chryseobacterium rhizosphaerae]